MLSGVALPFQAFCYADWNGDGEQHHREDEDGQNHSYKVQHDAPPPFDAQKLTVEDDDIDERNELVDGTHNAVRAGYEAQGKHQGGDGQGDARMVHLGAELLGVVEGELPSVVPLYLVLAEEPSTGQYGNEGEKDDAVEFVGPNLGDQLENEVDGSVFRGLEVFLDVDGGHFVEDRACVANDEGDDGIDGEHEDVHLQRVVVADSLAKQVILYHVTGSADEVADGIEKLVVAAHKGADEVVHHFDQAQAFCLGRLAALGTVVAFVGVSAVEALGSLFFFFHVNRSYCVPTTLPFCLPRRGTSPPCLRTPLHRCAPNRRDNGVWGRKGECRGVP